MAERDARRLVGIGPVKFDIEKHAGPVLRPLLERLDQRFLEPPRPYEWAGAYEFRAGTVLLHAGFVVVQAGVEVLLALQMRQAAREADELRDMVTGLRDGGQLALGELALNYNDGNLFYKDSGGTVRILTSTQFVNVGGNVTGANVLTAGQVSAGGNVTVGIGGTSNVAVFATTGEYITGVMSASGNVTGGNVLTGGVVSATGNITGNYILGDGSQLTNLPAGNYSNANVVSLLANFGSNVVSTTGNITSGYFVGNGSQLTDLQPTIVTNGTSNINIATPNGNVTVSVDSTGNVAVFSAAGLSLTGNLSVTGNVIGDYFVGNGTALTGVMADRGADPNNWNTLTQMGVYTVNRASWSGTVGTPLDSQVYVGLLQVMNSTETAITQVFLPGTVDANNVKIQWNRSYWSGTWTDWIKIVNDSQVVIGGDF